MTKDTEPELAGPTVGMELVRHYESSPGFLDLAWSGDGDLLAAAGANGGLTVWMAETGQARALTGHDTSTWVCAVSFHPRSIALASVSDDKTMRIWDRETNKSRKLCDLQAKGTGVAWSPDGDRIAVIDESGWVSLFNARNGEQLGRTFIGAHSLSGLHWSQDGRLLAAACKDHTVAVMSGSDLTERYKLRGHTAVVRDIALSDGDRYLASASEDSTVWIWDFSTGGHVATLEMDRTGTQVTDVTFTADGKYLVTVTRANLGEVWRCRDWVKIARYPGQHEALAVHPARPLIAVGNFHTRKIDCYQLDYRVLDRLQGVAGTRRYVNAKVVLLGDTGVGKSGLGLVLSGQKYKPTNSTHGRNVWTMASEPDQEILLWDLAGQPGYRLTHQLHLNEIVIALLVFDSRSETDPFSGVKYWARALAQARRLEGDAAVPMKAFLVAARADRGGAGVSNERIEAMVRDLELDGFYETSALEGFNVAELEQAIRDDIDWDALPIVSSSELFDSIKQFLLKRTQQGQELATVDELWRAYDGDPDERAGFDVCIGRVESRGLIRRLHFGDLVLLRPELLDAYASAMVQAAKDEPDGLGFIAEDKALQRGFRMPEGERVKDRAQERLLLIATVEELLRHEIALKEVTDQGVELVFPSQFTRERPDAPHIPGKAVVFGFEGPLTSIYATLAVRLAHSALFERKEMWQNAASYLAVGGGICGIHLRELEEGRGELSLFYQDAPAAVRSQFETYVHAHLRSRTIPGTLTRSTIRACPQCGYAIPEDLVKRRLDRGATTIRCPDCDEYVISLVDEAPAAPAVDVDVAAMNRSADEKRDAGAAELRVKGKIETGDYDVFLCYNSRDAEQVREIYNKLKSRGILPWFDQVDVQPGTRWQPALDKALRKVKAAAVIIGPGGPGPWQTLEIESRLVQMVQRNRVLIPVILEGRAGRPQLPPFLDLVNAVDFRQSDPDPFERLIFGITGDRHGILRVVA